MSTNYYLHTSPCPLCAHPVDTLHVGKSSDGWCFSLATHPRLGINDLDDWITRFTDPDCTIVDESGDGVLPDQMIDIITNRSGRDWDERWWPMGSEQDFHERNRSERGPGGLLRHQLSIYCCQHGEGTWDCMVGEFC